MSQPKERPILFSAPMVRAILEGRKTVTRRPIKPSMRGFDVSFELHQQDDGSWRPMHTFDESCMDAQGTEHPVICPFGKPGDRLWVRETWGVISHDFDQQGNAVDWEPDRPAQAIREMRFGRGYYSGHVVYAADGPCEWAGDEDGGGDPRSAWKPSIHMPRVASRILLEITDVRVERLQGISESQALAEGIVGVDFRPDDGFPICRGYMVGPDDGSSPLETHASKVFAGLWRSINGPESWDANPWVWVVEFKRIEP
ncbi:hypothetical protein ABFV43_17755 [Pseudomonas fulva]|uniref:hypothetical protein n=1 Tax=Pseudomonas fulva TaxID=47880 RepID=UPI0034D3F5CE